MSAYCKPLEHTWVQVIGGQGFDEDYDTKVCIRCECFNSTRKGWIPGPGVRVVREDARANARALEADFEMPDYTN